MCNGFTPHAARRIEEQRRSFPQRIAHLMMSVCTLSICCNFLAVDGNQTSLPYSTIGRIHVNKMQRGDQVDVTAATSSSAGRRQLQKNVNAGKM
jgi:hypothetical protein